MSKRVDHMQVQPGEEVLVRWERRGELFAYVAVEHEGELWAMIHGFPKTRIDLLSEAFELRVQRRRRRSFLRE